MFSGIKFKKFKKIKIDNVVINGKVKINDEGDNNNGIDKIRPPKAFLEEVSNIAIAIEIRKIKDMFFSNLSFLLSKNIAKENGHTMASHDPV